MDAGEARAALERLARDAQARRPGFIGADFVYSALREVLDNWPADPVDCERCGGNDATGGHERWCDA